jgi:predicted hydrocarbon binding protein
VFTKNNPKLKIDHKKWGTKMFFGQKEKIVIDRTEKVVSMFGYDLLREDVLPDLLGKEYHSILYWAGKSLARKYPVTSIESIIGFFKDASWGDLVLVKEKNSEAIFELTSSFFEHKQVFSTPLEAGFLAEQIQQIKGCITETNETAKDGKIKKMVFRVKWDQHDII